MGLMTDGLPDGVRYVRSYRHLDMIRFEASFPARSDLERYAVARELQELAGYPVAGYGRPRRVQVAPDGARMRWECEGRL